MAELKDAIGDAIIYMINFMDLSEETPPPDWPVVDVKHITNEDAMRKISLCISTIFAYATMSFEYFYIHQSFHIFSRALNAIAVNYGTTLDECFDMAWAEVYRRDWIKNPENGVSEQGKSQCLAKVPVPE